MFTNDGDSFDASDIFQNPEFQKAMPGVTVEGVTNQNTVKDTLPIHSDSCCQDLSNHLTNFKKKLSETTKILAAETSDIDTVTDIDPSAGIADVDHTFIEESISNFNKHNGKVEIPKATVPRNDRNAQVETNIRNDSCKIPEGVPVNVEKSNYSEGELVRHSELEAYVVKHNPGHSALITLPSKTSYFLPSPTPGQYYLYVEGSLQRFEVPEGFKVTALTGDKVSPQKIDVKPDTDPTDTIVQNARADVSGMVDPVEKQKVDANESNGGGKNNGYPVQTEDDTKPEPSGNQQKVDKIQKDEGPKERHDDEHTDPSDSDRKEPADALKMNKEEANPVEIHNGDGDLLKVDISDEGPKGPEIHDEHTDPYVGNKENSDCKETADALKMNEEEANPVEIHNGDGDLPKVDISDEGPKGPEIHDEHTDPYVGNKENSDCKETADVLKMNEEEANPVEIHNGDGDLPKVDISDDGPKGPEIHDEHTDPSVGNKENSDCKETADALKMNEEEANPVEIHNGDGDLPKVDISDDGPKGPEIHDEHTDPSVGNKENSDCKETADALKMNEEEANTVEIHNGDGHLPKVHKIHNDDGPQIHDDEHTALFVGRNEKCDRDETADELKMDKKEEVNQEEIHNGSGDLQKVDKIQKDDGPKVQEIHDEDTNSSVGSEKEESTDTDENKKSDGIFKLFKVTEVDSQESSDSDDTSDMQQYYADQSDEEVVFSDRSNENGIESLDLDEIFESDAESTKSSYAVSTKSSSRGKQARNRLTIRFPFQKTCSMMKGNTSLTVSPKNLLCDEKVQRVSNEELQHDVEKVPDLSVSKIGSERVEDGKDQRVSNEELQQLDANRRENIENVEKVADLGVSKIDSELVEVPSDTKTPKENIEKHSDTTVTLDDSE